MKHFSLRLALLLLAIAGFAAGAGALFARGLWAPATLAAIASLIAAAMLVALVQRLATVVTTFMKGILARDTTLRFDFGRHDPMLGDAARDMDTLARIYHESSSQLETSKLYYDRILKVMTHEMRNHVAPVIAITSHVADNPARYPDAASLREVVALIHTQSTGIRRFLDAYYRLTHLPPLAPETISAAAFTERIMQLLPGELAARGLAPGVCRFDVARGMQLTVDVALMTQVMLNLLRNALDAVAGVEHPAVAVTMSLAQGAPRITIADNGPGIPPRDIENLFQPFYTTKPGGSGVGLALSRQIVRRHRGDLTLLPARPTTFAISLPPSPHN